MQFWIKFVVTNSRPNLLDHGGYLIVEVVPPLMPNGKELLSEESWDESSPPAELSMPVIGYWQRGQILFEKQSTDDTEKIFIANNSFICKSRYPDQAIEWVAAGSCSIKHFWKKLNCKLSGVTENNNRSARDNTGNSSLNLYQIKYYSVCICERVSNVLQILYLRKVCKILVMESVRK